MLTKGIHNVLERMAKGEELVEAIPGGWWLGNTCIDGRIGWSLLRNTFISETQGSSSVCIYYHINELGLAVLHMNGG